MEYSQTYRHRFTKLYFQPDSPNKTTLVASEIIEANLITLLLYCSSLFTQTVNNRYTKIKK